jgi:hypothetical protein
MPTLTPLPVIGYRIYDAWTKETLFESTDYQEAEREFYEWQTKHPENQIDFLAVIIN